MRHTARRYGRNGLDSHILILGYNIATPELRPEQALERASPCCNLVPGHRRCRYWRHPHYSADDPDEQAGYLFDRAGADIHTLYYWRYVYATQANPEKATARRFSLRLSQRGWT